MDESHSGLTEREQRILDFEKKWWRVQPLKEEAIRREFHISPLRYFQQLNRLLDKPEALTAEPVVVKRLLEIRDSS